MEEIQKKHRFIDARTAHRYFTVPVSLQHHSSASLALKRSTGISDLQSVPAVLGLQEFRPIAWCIFYFLYSDTPQIFPFKNYY